MAKIVSLIGYGEAARTFAVSAEWKKYTAVFDLKPFEALYEQDGVAGYASCEGAVAGSPVIISLVTADQALIAAQVAARGIAPGALYFDMNSVAPDTKFKAAHVIESAGGRYVDVAIMAPVGLPRLGVPLLVSGPDAEDAVNALNALGFQNVCSVGPKVGRASSIKMIRSIIIKGQEALTAEMMMAAQAAGVVDDVLNSLGDGWGVKAEYNLERMRTHGNRRAAEMVEVANTLIALGVKPVMTQSTIIRQREMAA